MEIESCGTWAPPVVPVDNLCLLIIGKVIFLKIVPLPYLKKIVTVLMYGLAQKYETKRNNNNYFI